MNSQTFINLSEPLPYPSKYRWGYQHFPVFSPTWWRGRALVFGLGVLCLSLMTGIGMVIDFDNKQAALLTTGKFFLGVGGMAYAGATACTLVRTYLRPGKLQQVFIVIALLLGLACAVAFDAWSSAAIEQAFLDHSSQKDQLQALATANTQNSAVMLLNAMFGFALYFWLAGGIAFIRYWREPIHIRAHLADQELRDVKIRKHEIETRLSVLQAQIEPHFLFNSLASIKSVVRDNPELAESSIDDFVNYLRASMPRLNNQQLAQPTTLEEQVVLCEKYLKVMQLRMGERLSFASEIEPTVAALAFPPLVMVSLVENAIKHGIEPKQKGGHIKISAYAVESDLVIEIADTGVGLNNSGAHGLSSGVGLTNIKNQLKVLFGDSATLDLSENSMGGVTARIKITNLLLSK